MALTPSNMLALGTTAPDFNLPDTISGKTITLNDIKGTKGTLVMFMCNHCPYVVHVEAELIKLGQDYKNSGIGIVAISANDAAQYPDDAPEKMRERAKAKGYEFAYLYDESQQVAKDYQAACTPDFFLFDSNLELVYRGQLDDSRPGNKIPVTGKDLRQAMNATINGEPVVGEQIASVGCNIKWRVSVQLCSISSLLIW